MAENKTVEILFVYETAAQSWLRDASSAAMFLALIGIGVWLDSGAMQWVGAILGFFVIISKSIHLGRKNRLTIEQARKRLDEIESAHPQSNRAGAAW